MNLAQILALMPSLMKAMADLQVTIANLRRIAEQQGATAEQLAELDSRLSDAIEERERELRGGA